MKFMGLRHGGNTAAADAGLTDAQMRALSGHHSPETMQLYAKKTTKQRRDGARKLLEGQNEQREFVGMSKRCFVGMRDRAPAKLLKEWWVM
jgi:hypothetical protein